MKNGLIQKLLFPFDNDHKIEVDSTAAWHAQIHSIFRNMPLVLFTDMVVGTFLFLVLLSSIGGLAPWVWYSLLSITCLTRAVFVYLYKANPRFMALSRSRWKFLLFGATISGAVWGSAWLVLPHPASITEMGLVVLWQCGVLAGAAASFPILKNLFFSFALSPIIITTTYLFYYNTDTTLVLAGAFLSYVAFIIPLGLHIGADLNRGIFLQIRNTSLEASLKEDGERLKEKEAQLRDMTAEKIFADKKLKSAAEERLLLLDSIEEGIFGINSIGKITFMNSSALKLLNVEEEEVLGVKAEKLVRRRGGDIDIFTRCRRAITDCYQTGRPTIAMQGEFTALNGEVLPVRFSCWPIFKDIKIIGAVISFSDISKQLEMEQLLIQSQKMEAIGRITGGVSHDFNNLLTVIMGNLQFLQRQVQDEEQKRDLVDKIMKAARSGADLVSQLLSFSREQELEASAVDINDLVHDIEGFLKRILSEEIDLEISTCEEACLGMTDRTQLQNAIFNLCVNARDAMPNGGKLSISVRKTIPTWARSDSKNRTPDKEYIELTVKDSGLGMSEEVKKNVFEPFFTTKEKHKGSGLGLSMVYGFMKQSGGNVTMESSEGMGTSFRLFIPVATDETFEKPESAAPIESNRKFSGTILVVEDDDNVRSVAAHMLVDAGYEVVTARNGKAGLEQFLKHPEIDLVFSDIIMPGGMNGIEMAKRILKKNPNAPILLATGYTEKAVKDGISKLENIMCVSKPYDTNELPKVVNSLIDKVAS
ncbi:MAG: hypothetical protein DHS20C12_16750 [Pseudohongiella sp.]|nr:MAG: hypothetical protein DHS20C12_16750 [Pseudohongiella sp.]